MFTVLRHKNGTEKNASSQWSNGHDLRCLYILHVNILCSSGNELLFGMKWGLYSVAKYINDAKIDLVHYFCQIKKMLNYLISAIIHNESCDKMQHFCEYSQSYLSKQASMRGLRMLLDTKEWLKQLLYIRNDFWSDIEE